MRGGTKSRVICNLTDASEKRALSANAMFSCGKCGAMAHDPSNVCDPVQYPEEGILGD